MDAQRETGISADQGVHPQNDAERTGQGRREALTSQP